jgi:feruloyl esterase
MLDGAGDGIISNIAACKSVTAPFKLTTAQNPLRCANGANGADDCLSDAQIAALNSFDSPYETGFPVFKDDTTTAVFPKWTPFEGSTFRDNNQTILGAEGPRQALQASPGDATNRFAIAQDLTLNVFEDFDAQQYAGRIVEVAARISANSAIIDRYRANGGKLIFFHGLIDDFITPYSSIQYYERLLTRYGQDGLDEFVRFYTVPGMGHGNGLFAARMSTLDALEAWVERGEAPGELVAIDNAEATAGRTRPVCLYPLWPRYDGSGDINVASSYACVNE